MASRVRDELIGMIDRALGDDPKAALIASRQLKDEVEWLTERSVALARREGYDWGRISRLLGTTRQWARERFKAAPPRLPRGLRRSTRPDKDTDRDDDIVGW